MVKQEPALIRRTQVLESKVAHHGVLYVPKNEGTLKVIPGDAKADDGINPSRVIVDEVHRISNRAMIDLLGESFSARAEPLIVYITTAGEDDGTSVACELRDHADKVADGRISDPYFFHFVRSATIEETDGDGWKDEELWRRVNPAIDSFNPGMLSDLRVSAAAAEGSPVKIATFKRLRLGVWLPPGVTNRNRLVDVLSWDRSAGSVDVAELRGRTAYGGLDMASSEDIAALVGVFPREGCLNAFCESELCFEILARFFVPASNLEGEGTTWNQNLVETMRGWVADGWVTAVDGDVIDDRDVHAVVDEWRDLYDLRELAKDPHQTKQLGIELEEEGLVVVDHGPTMVRMAEPTEQFIRKVRQRTVHHGGNPVLRWMIGNTIGKVDGYGNKRPDRKTSDGKIDGVIATIIGLASEERNREPGFDEFVGLRLGGSA
jgi:phage terminase large subunit-like protein